MAVRGLVAATVVLTVMTWALHAGGDGGEKWWALEVGRPVDARPSVIAQTAARLRPRAERFRSTATGPSSQLTVITFNIRFARRDDGSHDLTAVAELLARYEADVIALQKVERFSPRSGFVDQARWLASALGMDLVFGPTIALGPSAYGNAVLSRHPVTAVANHPLPSRLEPRALLEVEVDSPLGPVRVYNTHLGLNDEERRVQANAVRRHASLSPVPVIIAGDWNASPWHPEVAMLADRYADAFASGASPGAPGYTIAFNSDTANRRIDYIFVDPRFAVRSAHVVPEWISNHYPVVVVLAADRAEP